MSIANVSDTKKRPFVWFGPIAQIGLSGGITFVELVRAPSSQCLNHIDIVDKRQSSAFCDCTCIGLWVCDIFVFFWPPSFPQIYHMFVPRARLIGSTTFKANLAFRGGAIYTDDGYEGDGFPTATTTFPDDTVFEGNTAEVRKGALRKRPVCAIIY